ncbi:MAG: tyrosine-type recombinase/integrase [Pyrinomonadaceae bacterium]
MANDRSGYVFQNKQGAWYARTTITDSSGNRRNIKRRAKDKRDAKAILKRILHQLDVEGSKFADTSSLTFNDLADFYQNHYCKPAEYVDGKKVSGLRDVQRAQSVLVRFRSYFGKRRLRDITYSDIRAYYTMRLKQPTHYDKPPTIATMNRELGVLRRTLNIAVREGWLSRNPFSAGESLISPASERRRERILTLDEERNLLEACERRMDLRALCICLLDTGARLSEFLIHLRWRSVCFATRTITLEAMTTKTLKARQVRMTERMFQELKALRELYPRVKNARVFNLTVRIVRREFKLACEAAGISYGSPYGITLHSLRHSAATRLVKGQMPLQMVGRILGHSQPQTTYRYLSADAEATAQAAAIMEALQTQPIEAEASPAHTYLN